MTLKKHTLIVGFVLGLLGSSLAPPASAQAASGATAPAQRSQSQSRPTKQPSKSQASASKPAASTAQATAASAAPADITPAAPTFPVVQPNVVPGDALQKLLDQNKITLILNDPKNPPKPEDLQKAYLVVWVTIANSFHDPSKVQNFERWRALAAKIDSTAKLEDALKLLLNSLHDPSTQYTTAADAALALANQPKATPPVVAATSAPAKPAPQAPVSAQPANASLTGATAAPAQAAAPAPDQQPTVLGFTIAKLSTGNFKVDYLSYGSPAYDSDLRPGDLVTSIGGKALTGMTASDANALTHVKTGDKVEIVFHHDGKEDKLTLTAIAPPEVKGSAELAKNGILIVRLPDFSDKQVQAFEGVLGQAEKATNSKLTGIILDLRGNPGGSLDSTIDVSSLFISDGPIVGVTSRQGRLLTPKIYEVIPPMADKLAANPQMAKIFANLYSAPMVVVTDNSTAGTAEILAGALKDNKRAYVVGTTTYGHNVISTKETYATGGVVQIATQDYVTPGGVNLATKGLAPNKEVARARAQKTKKDDVMEAAMTALTAQQEAAKHKGAGGDTSSDDDGGNTFSSKIMSAFAVSMVLLVIVLYTVYERQRKRREAQRQAESQKKSGR